MPYIYFAAGPGNWADYEQPLSEALRKAGIKATLSPEVPADPAQVDYIVYAPVGTMTDFSPFKNCKAVLSLWAGVEKIVHTPSLTQPLARMVNTELTEGMVEYVVGHALRHHLGMDAHIHGQDGVWRNAIMPPLARERTVAVLGLGELGQASARALAALNFNVLGWSRSLKSVPGVECHAGEDGLDEVLARAEIVVLLMPLTPDTTNVLNARRLALLPQGAVIINPGRGPLIDSPGLTEFGLHHLSAEEIAAAFRELRPLVGHCRFRDCRHDREPDCSVLAAVRHGDIDPRRYAAYRSLCAEIG